MQQLLPCRQKMFLQKEATINLKDIYNKEKGNLASILNNDPVEFCHRYSAKEDIEIAGFLASQFAYGKIELFKRFLEDIFALMGESPKTFIERGDFTRFEGLYYRFQKDRDIMLLFESLRKIYEGFGGIGAMFKTYYQGDVRETLWKMREYLLSDSNELIFFFPKPSATNPLKRWNLYLRWMVRKDTIDSGIWDFMDKSDLVIPLDTHIFKIGRCFGWTKRNTPSYAAAREITGVLKDFSPEDPLEYDFFLCHRIGIGAGCTGKRGPQCKKVCLLYG